MTNREHFQELVIRKLGEFAELNYLETWQAIRGNRLAAGVLLIFSGSQDDHNQVYVHLIKRSRRVTQGGDISCPGGMLNPRLDKMLAFFIRCGIFPVMDVAARQWAKKRGADTFTLISLFLANALRETWEEIGLRPWNIKFIGPLPPYSLYTFQRTIFPVVGWATHPWKAKPSREVEKILKVPLTTFFETSNYTHFLVTSQGDQAYRLELPAFVILDEEGQKEILWGATFNIIMKFLQVVFGFSLPAIPENAIFHRVLTQEYMKGNRYL
ncbi:MAG: CoA pyrophosphatase [Syntrophales bacterium]|nr:CoA pyrophosphatase [Syntrophales bacterium]